MSRTAMYESMRGKLKKLVVLLLVAGGLTALMSVVALNVVSWLKGNDEPVPARVI